jgi:hypothetical protein
VGNATHPPTQLSGGQRERVATAGAAMVLTYEHAIADRTAPQSRDSARTLSTPVATECSDSRWPRRRATPESERVPLEIFRADTRAVWACGASKMADSAAGVQAVDGRR